MAIPIIIGGMAASALAGFLISEFTGRTDFEEGRKQGEQETKAKYSEAFEQANQRNQEAQLYFNRLIASSALCVSIINHFHGKVTKEEISQVKNMIAGESCEMLPPNVSKHIDLLRDDTPSVKEALIACFEVKIPRVHTYELMLEMIDDEAEQQRFISMFDRIYNDIPTEQETEASASDDTNIDHVVSAKEVFSDLAIAQLSESLGVANLTSNADKVNDKSAIASLAGVSRLFKLF